MLPRPVPFILGLIAATWAAAIAFSVHLDVPVGEALTDWQMHTGGSEELREALGLGIVAAWMGVLGARPRASPCRS